MLIVHTCTFFHQYVADIQFIVFTDNCGACYLKDCRHLTGSVMRSTLRLQPYKFEIKYVRGVRNRTLDFLSGYALKEILEEERQFRVGVLAINNIILDKVKVLTEEQQKEPELKVLIQ